MRIQFTKSEINLMKATTMFWEKAIIEYGCWGWKGSTDKDGYGQMYLNNKRIHAHRMSYLIHYGPILGGVLICHHCDNPPCANPKHIYRGSFQSNANDYLRRGKNTPYVLTEKIVLEARHLYNTTDLSYSDLAKRFKCKAGTLAQAIEGRRWKYLRSLKVGEGT